MLEPILIYQMALPVYVMLLILAMKNRRKFLPIIFQSILFWYIVVVMDITLFPIPFQEPAIIHPLPFNFLEDNNFIPFNFIKESITRLTPDPRAPYIPFYDSFKVVLHQVGGNILLGVPFGFLAPLVWKKRNTFWKVLLAGLAFSVAIETSQFLISFILKYTYRIADIDDVILNTMGVALGYLAYKLALKLIKIIKNFRVHREA